MKITNKENQTFDDIKHSASAGKLSKCANNAEIEIKDYKLTRYACYLIAQKDYIMEKPQILQNFVNCGIINT